ncbi:MAG: hypothetical protein IPN08_12445 [Bacteroidales bacterium]|nr:hypothetical protein [Bacteroidales bacterium]
MYRQIYLTILTALLLLAGSCCDCSNREQTFSEDELSWIPDGQVGDSVVFVNGNGGTKTFFIRVSDQSIDEVKCAGPCFCNCPEDNTGYYRFELTGEQIPNTIGIYEGLNINLRKTDDFCEKTYTWSCPDGSFHDFDYSIDTMTINGRLYNDILVKELTVCHIRKIYFSRANGLLRFDYDDGVWERLN